MPKCWFVLLRFWLRVDRVLVRLYETRLMGSFNWATGAPLVSREMRHSEGTFEQLRSTGAPPAGVRVSSDLACIGVMLALQTLQSRDYTQAMGSLLQFAAS